MRIIDANVLLYAVNERSPHHVAAKAWLDGALSGRETVAFAWVVLLAFIRLATHPRVFPNPLPPADAISIVKAWLAQPTAVVIAAGDRHPDVLEALLAELGAGGNLVNDAHLAALALEHDGEVVSFDSDFARFAEVRWSAPGTHADQEDG